MLSQHLNAFQHLHQVCWDGAYEIMKLYLSISTVWSESASHVSEIPITENLLLILVKKLTKLSKLRLRLRIFKWSNEKKMELLEELVLSNNSLNLCSV